MIIYRNKITNAFQTGTAKIIVKIPRNRKVMARVMAIWPEKCVKTLIRKKSIKLVRKDSTQL